MVRTELRKVAETSGCGLDREWQFCLRRQSQNRELQLERHRPEHPVQTKEMGQASVPGSEARWSLVTMATCYMGYTRNDVSLDGGKEGCETREATQLSPEADLNDQVSKQASFKGWGPFFSNGLLGRCSGCRTGCCRPLCL